MYYKLFVLCLVTSASGQGLLDALFGGIASLVNGLSYVYKPAGQEDSYLNINQLAEKYGYTLETHTVVTEDGYILNIHRMPHGRNAKRKGRCVFLMHGIWESSDSWLLQGPGKALAYILADEGYDVWMGNARGNRYSTLHKSLNTNTSTFWDFSWEEIGFYDLPVMIDYVLDTTGTQDLYYVGFSQGTTTFFVMNSMRPEYNKKVKLMFALAPEAFMGNATSILLKIFSPAHSYLKYILWNFNVYSPSTDLFNRVVPFFCNVLPVRCDNIFLSFVGPHHVNESMWTVILGHVPTGSSTLQFIHYGQLAHYGRFCRFDFGVAKNTELYGQQFPPDYNLTAVTSPVVLFYSGNDLFSDQRDVELLKSELPKVTEAYYVKQFSHVDFMYSDEASTLIYSNIVKHIKNDR